MRTNFVCPKCSKKGVYLRIDAFLYFCTFCKESITPQSLSKANPPVPVLTTPRHISISDVAWESLSANARDYGYLRTQERGRLGFYVAALSQIPTQNFADTRPNFLAHTDQWYTGADYMRPRMVRLSSVTIDAYGVLASHFRVAPFLVQRPVILGRSARVQPDPTRHSALAYVAPVLEAIGLGWLTPRDIPQASPDLWATRQRFSRATRNTHLY